MFNERINVSLALSNLQGVQHIGKIGSKIFLNKGARLQLQGGQVTQLQQSGGQMQGQKIPSCILMCQEGLNSPSWGAGDFPSFTFLPDILRLRWFKSVFIWQHYTGAVVMASPVSLESVRGGLGLLTRYFSIEIRKKVEPDLPPAAALFCAPHYI